MTERLSCVDVKLIPSSKIFFINHINNEKLLSGCKNDFRNIVICPYKCRTCTFRNGRNDAFPPITQILESGEFQTKKSNSFMFRVRLCSVEFPCLYNVIGFVGNHHPFLRYCPAPNFAYSHLYRVGFLYRIEVDIFLPFIIRFRIDFLCLFQEGIQ